jgi:hypothetical protein
MTTEKKQELQAKVESLLEQAETDTHNNTTPVSIEQESRWKYEANFKLELAKAYIELLKT